MSRVRKIASFSAVSAPRRHQQNALAGKFERRVFWCRSPRPASILMSVCAKIEMPRCRSRCGELVLPKSKIYHEKIDVQKVESARNSSRICGDFSGIDMDLAG